MAEVLAAGMGAPRDGLERPGDAYYDGGDRTEQGVTEWVRENWAGMLMQAVLEKLGWVSATEGANPSVQQYVQQMSPTQAMEVYKTCGKEVLQQMTNTSASQRLNTLPMSQKELTEQSLELPVVPLDGWFIPIMDMDMQPLERNPIKENRQEHGIRTTSGYGNRTVFGGHDFHEGMDFAVEAGKEGYPIVAMGPGLVEQVFSQPGGAGNCVKVRYCVSRCTDENGQESAQYVTAYYSHLDKITPELRAGDRVDTMTVLGTLGNTGRSTGAHLDFRFFLVDDVSQRTSSKRNQHIDPTPYMYTLGERREQAAAREREQQAAQQAADAATAEGFLERVSSWFAS